MKPNTWREGWIKLTDIDGTSLLVKKSYACETWADVDRVESERRGFKSVEHMRQFYGIKSLISK